MPKPGEGDFVVPGLHFESGEVLRNLRLHSTTYGKPVWDASGRVTNAVMILHGTVGSGHQFMQSKFAGVLFGSGQLLDAHRYYITRSGWQKLAWYLWAWVLPALGGFTDLIP